MSVGAVVKSGLFSVVVAFAVFVPDAKSADNRFHHHRLIDRIVVFGDSLSDSGNAFALLGGDFVAPPDYGMGDFDPPDPPGIPEVIALIPDAPYRTERFSNGQHTWIEILANGVGLGPSAKPAFAGSHWQASNYAVGAARATAVGDAHLSQQVELFLLHTGGLAPSNALYVVQIGGNDIRDALLAANPQDVIAAAVDSLIQNIQALYSAGGRKFLVWNVPDVGSTPALKRLNEVPLLTGIAVAATFLSGTYNALLDIRLELLAANLDEIDIVPFNVFDKLHEIQENPRRFGLGDAQTACIQPHVPTFGVISSPPFRCKHPEDHFFWDGIHPTRAGHRIIANLVSKELRAELVLDD